MSESSKKCRLYLIVPPNPGPGMVRDLTEALGAGDVACVLLRQDKDNPGDAEILGALTKAAQEKQALVLIEDDAQMAISLGANGVHLSSPFTQDAQAFDSTREILGDDGIIGACCGESRHNAMIMAETGVDYIAYGPDAGEPDIDAASRLEFIQWANELFLIQCVAWNIEQLDDVKALAAAGADFVALEKAVWGHAQGAVEAIKSLSS